MLKNIEYVTFLLIFGKSIDFFDETVYIQDKNSRYNYFL